jgi:hypothetical protein
MKERKKNHGRHVMETTHREHTSPFRTTGEPRPGDVAITVLTAFILLLVLIVVAVL